MDLILAKMVQDLKDVEILELYNDNSFEFSFKNSWYFVGQDEYGRYEVATRNSSKEVFNTVRQTYNYIESICK